MHTSFRRLVAGAVRFIQQSAVVKTRGCSESASWYDNNDAKAYSVEPKSESNNVPAVVRYIDFPASAESGMSDTDGTVDASWCMAECAAESECRGFVIKENNFTPLRQCILLRSFPCLGTENDPGMEVEVFFRSHGIQVTPPPPRRTQSLPVSISPC